LKLAKYPPVISGHTVSNLILVSPFGIGDNLDLQKIKEFQGFTITHNSRDVFLNVNAIRKNASVENITKVLIHETFHNVLTKYVSETASGQLDNLVDKKKYADKIKLKLFGVRRLSKLSIKKRKGRKYRLDRDFWLSRMNVGSMK
jgi:hypothetical protein